MPGEIHDQLVALGERWQKRQGFAVVATEIAVRGTEEEADVIGFRSSCSAVLEAKASRSDFLADAKKPHRASGGLGVYRFYICPPGVIEVVDLPPGWGLLHAVGSKVIEVLRPTGNIWPAYGTTSGDWARFQHAPDLAAERAVLFSISRRRSLSRSDERYEHQLRNAARERGRLARRNDELGKQVGLLQAQLAATRAPVGETVGELRAAVRRKLSQDPPRRAKNDRESEPDSPKGLSGICDDRAA
ncbi:hypothetical protein [Paraburkholderia fungorum]|uniref:hypothetical protein n=1 Tax=Paraburkholderia fungorum TaxID=134537 RepID=UPI0007C5D21B|nr:hypothetical protein [Paraburkholderia fungorum]MBB5546573.1 hypothetical protein [Paraburkholderia fungorum]